MEVLADEICWFAMRDLKRANAKLPAYKQLTEAGFEVFTPMTTRVATIRGRRVKQRIPYMSDLLFVHANRATLDPIVARTDTLQYRYAKGQGYCTPIVVRDAEMDTFMHFIRTTDDVTYYQPDEITPSMYGRMVRLVCDGPLDGYECRLLSARGTTRRRILIQLSGLLSAAIEINPSYIQLL